MSNRDAGNVSDTKAAQWVAMSDVLPPLNTPVLICASDGTISAASLEHEPENDWVFWNGAGFGGPEWDWDWEKSREPWKGVTHWMPLPRPPNAETN